MFRRGKMPGHKAYIVTTPIAPLLGYILPTHQAVSSSLHMVQDERGSYLFEAAVDAPTAREAVRIADSALDDWLRCLAVRGVAMCRLQDGRREVLLGDAADYDPETEDVPDDAVTFVETPEGYRWRDPDGSLRRSGEIPDFRIGRVGVTRSDLQTEVGWFHERSRWPMRLRRAMALAYVAECLEEPDARFAQWYFAFEILSPSPQKPLVAARIPRPGTRRRLVGELRELLEAYFALGAEVDRLIDAVKAAHPKSAIDLQLEYLNGLGVEVVGADLKWWRAQRGTFVHATEFDCSDVARERREAFCGLARECIMVELYKLSGGMRKPVIMLRP